MYHQLKLLVRGERGGVRVPANESVHGIPPTVAGRRVNPGCDDFALLEDQVMNAILRLQFIE